MSTFREPAFIALYIVLLIFNELVSPLEKREAQDRGDVTDEAPVRLGRRRGRERSMVRGMRGSGSVVSTDNRRAAVDRTASSVSDPFGKNVYLYLL